MSSAKGRASVVVVADCDGSAFREHLTSVLAAVGADGELLLVDATASGLADLRADGVRAVRAAGAGRRAALAAAAEQASGDVLVALATGSRPRAGFVAPLRDAVLGGAPLVAPLVETAGGTAWGYRREPDGSLLPRRGRDDGSLDALALDCLAAAPGFFRGPFPAFDVSESLYETLVAAAAGSLALAEDAAVERVSAGPAASVIVCTHDRADEVGPCLDALAAAGAHRGSGEIVVVANACSDETADVVRERAARLGGRIRLVEDPIAGLSRARNAGAAAAGGEVLLYLDDDARPAPGWLEAIRDAFVDGSVSLAGGPIAGLWPPGRPAGFPGPRLQSFYSVLDRGDARELSECGDIYGANFAVRADVLARCGGFDPRWGEGRRSAVVGDDTEFCARAARLGAGRTAYVPAAAVGHRIAPPRVDEAWLARRVYRHGLVLPHARAAFLEPDREQLGRIAQAAASELFATSSLAGTLSVRAALERVLNEPRSLDERMDAARSLGMLARALVLQGADRCRAGALELTVAEDEAAGSVELPRRRSPASRRDLGILAIVPAYNEADVIAQTVEALLAEGIEVYLLDNGSTDGTADRVQHLLGRGLLHVERFPEDAGYPQRDEFVLRDQLRRFSEIAEEQGHDWVLIADADEFRESPFPDLSLSEAIRFADRLGYNAVDFALFNFRPVDDAFVPGTDVRAALGSYECGESFDAGQIKCWKNVPGVDLRDLFGVGAQFPGRRVFPVRFILRHYPIRGETHGRRKVLRERLGRFAAEERAGGWHVQYDGFADGARSFLWDPATLTGWDGDAVRARLLADGMRDLLTALCVRGLDVVQTPVDRAAAARWLGHAEPVEQLAAEVVEAARRGGGQELEPGRVDRMRDILDLLRTEAAVLGNPVERRALEDLRHALLDPDRQSRLVLAFADDLLLEPELLSRYCKAFDAADRVTLAVVAAQEELDALSALVPEQSPDVLAVAEPPEAPVALYARRGRDGVGGLPRFDDTTLGELRRALGLEVTEAA